MPGKLQDHSVSAELRPRNMVEIFFGRYSIINMSCWNTIIHPHTNEPVQLNSRRGHAVLRAYLRTLRLRGGSQQEEKKTVAEVEDEAAAALRSRENQVFRDARAVRTVAAFCAVANRLNGALCNPRILLGVAQYFKIPNRNADKRIEHVA